MSLELCHSCCGLWQVPSPLAASVHSSELKEPELTWAIYEPFKWRGRGYSLAA